jgi:hypothetical protein
MARRTVVLFTTLSLAFLLVAAAQAENLKSTACLTQAYSYAGVTSGSRANGVSATLVSTAAPKVTDGHVAGWIGIGGQSAGPDGSAEWLQAGFAAFTSDQTSRMYYEVVTPTSPNAATYHELRAHVAPGEKHRFALLEMGARKSWWRVWVDGRPVSPPIHLPGSHGAWYPQAVGENWNGGSGTCNRYAYEFSNLALAQTNGGRWRPFSSFSTFEDPGYRIVGGSTATRFLATSL